MNTSLDKMLGIDYPVLMAPMFLISNEAMTIAALEAGITAAIPALNYRTIDELKAAIHSIRSKTDKPFGINLIVNKSNPKYKSQLAAVVAAKVDFIITSLGSPKEVIDACKPAGIKVFCDVVNLEYARKVEALGADGVIAVNNRAGGHSGNQSEELLIAELVNHLQIPVISAGGITSKQDVDRVIKLGAAGVSVGTVFIATQEAPVSEEYKQALVEYGEKDVVWTDKMSGSPLTVINTPYLKKVGTKASFFERLLLKNKWLKKYVKLIIALRGVNKIRKSAKGATYKTVWVAGPSIESIQGISRVKEVVKKLISAA